MGNLLSVINISYSQQKKQNQRGIALPMALLFLLVMTLLGVTALRITTMEEQMASNARVREIAFNAAETTLRFAESEVQNKLALVIRAGDLPGNTGVKLYEQKLGTAGYPDLDASTHNGDTCVGGYCIPVQYHLSAGAVPVKERWEDPDLDVWNNSDRHLEYLQLNVSGMEAEGVFESPKYIVEFLGNYPAKKPDGTSEESVCDVATTVDLEALFSWPYCLDDEAYFRITARAVAGNPGRQGVVVLQSTIAVIP